jgi:1-(5-phosphoribosyl)-5-[(5-phosphoribosylamino)methylideneamino] imidazole-4-carboxamide isomerase/N-(5'phosphoribosyl)anthranilate isomerase
MSGDNGPFELYPAVDIRDGRAVRLTQGRADAATEYDDPIDAALRFAAAGTRWLHVVDLDAAFTGEPRNRHLIEQIVDATGCEVQASGGIRTLEDIRAALGFGAARVVVGTMALTDPTFVPAALEVAGERLAVGLDAQGEVLRARGWTEDAGDLFEVLGRLDALGVARFIFTDIETDGMLSGPNLSMLTRVAEATSAAVTASGGVASVADLTTLAALHPRVDGAIVGRALYSGDVDLGAALAAVAAIER